MGGAYLDGVKARGLRSYDNIQRAFRRFFEDVQPGQKVEALTGQSSAAPSRSLGRTDQRHGSQQSKNAPFLRLDLGRPVSGSAVSKSIHRGRQVQVRAKSLVCSAHGRFLEGLRGGQRKAPGHFAVLPLHGGAADEIKRLKWSDVDFENGLVRLWTRKRKSAGRV